MFTPGRRPSRKGSVKFPLHVFSEGPIFQFHVVGKVGGKVLIGTLSGPETEKKIKKSYLRPPFVHEGVDCGRGRTKDLYGFRRVESQRDVASSRQYCRVNSG